MPVTVPAKTEDSIGVEKSDALPEGFTPNPKHYTSAAQLERMKDSLIEIAEKVNELEGGVTVDPSDDVPSDISTAAGSAGVAVEYSRADHVHELGVLTGADFADPVLRSASSDLGGSGAQLTPGGLTTGGTSGGTDLLIAPGAATAGAGKAVLIQAGTGAASQNGGPLTLDAGGPNGGGSSAGNVRIGRDVAAEVLIGKEGGGATVTLEGTVTTVGHTPTAPGHVATKDYVDAVAAGLSVKKGVRVATTTAGTLATSFEAGDTVDGVVLVAGDRLLVKDQAAGQENGIYVVAASGAPTRATDMDAAAEIEAGVAVFVEEGTANANTGWVLTTDGAIVVGTTPLAFSLFSRHSVGLVGDIQAVGTANAAGTSGKVADAGHVHAHGAQTDGSLHALATKDAHGFVAAADYDRVLGDAKNSEVIFRDEFTDNISKWTAVVSGASAAVAVTNAGSGRHNACRLYCGTTTTGTAELSQPVNGMYTNRYSSLRFRVKVEVSALSNATDEYDLYVCWTGVNGVGFVYDRNTSTNWQRATFAAGVPTLTDTGVAVAAGTVYDLTWIWTPAAGGTVTFYVNGTSVGSVTGIAQYGVFMSPGRMIKSAGTGAPFTYIDFAEAIGVLATPRN